MEQAQKVSVANTDNVEFDCPTHGKVRVEIYNLGRGWSDPACSKCYQDKENTKREEEKERAAARQREAVRAAMEGRLRSSMIPPRFKDHSFDTFVAENDEQADRLAKCRHYAEEFPDMLSRGTSMILTGGTGTGKTHLACSIANHVIQHHNKAALFMRVVKAIRQVKESYNKTSKVSEQEAINWFIQPDLLILDEAGVQFGSDAEKMILFEILDERYQNMKPTILISNLSLANLKEFIGDRVLDRFRENGGKALRFEWASHRGAKILE